MKKLLVFFICYVFTLNAHADGEFQTVEEILNRTPDSTPCATGIFTNVLSANAGAVSEHDDEQVIQSWIYGVMSMPDVLQSVLACPEFQSLDETEHIKLQSIKYTFPGGREIVINYETQPKILRQRVMLGFKRGVDDLNDPNPKIGALDDKSVWINTDPAWYAIMVVQHGALDKFIGADKNNTISLKYIEDNIDTLYPNGNVYQ